MTGRKPSAPIPHPYELPLKPGVFFATGSKADTVKLTGAERKLRDVRHHIERAERQLIEDRKLTFDERAELESKLESVKAKIAAVPAGHVFTMGEMLSIDDDLKTLREFSYRKRFNDDRTGQARAGKARREARHDGLIVAKWLADKTNIFNMDLVNREIIAKGIIVKTKAGEKPDIFSTKRFNKRVAALGLRADGKLSKK